MGYTEARVYVDRFSNRHRFVQLEVLTTAELNGLIVQISAPISQWRAEITPVRRS